MNIYLQMHPDKFISIPAMFGFTRQFFHGFNIILHTPSSCRYEISSSSDGWLGFHIHKSYIVMIAFTWAHLWSVDDSSTFRWLHIQDLWSLGCILWELYSGNMLFETHNSVEHLARGPGARCWPGGHEMIRLGSNGIIKDEDTHRQTNTRTHTHI